MKKAKIIMSSIAVLAVLGGVFSFKAKRYLDPNVYTRTTTMLNGPITCTFTKFVTTAEVDGIATTTYTTPLCNALVATFITASDN